MVRGPTSNDLYELRASHREEGHLGLCGYRLGQQRLPAAGGAEQQCALRDLGSELQEALWALEKQQRTRTDPRRSREPSGHDSRGPWVMSTWLWESRVLCGDG